MRRRDFLTGSIAAGTGVRLVKATPDSQEFATKQSASLKRAFIVPFDLRCESLSEPLGVNAKSPRLSWKLKAAGSARNQRQTGYRIKVASLPSLLESDRVDLWDSGHVQSDKQLHIVYQGQALQAGQRCFWCVEVWDQSGRKSATSPMACWEMGLLTASEWKGRWISDGKGEPKTEAAQYEDDPAPLFRKSFVVDKPVSSARLYVASLGYHHVRMNGQPVSDHVLEPAWTSTKQIIPYTCYDLTNQLVEGENVLGGTLGNGWFNPLPLRMWGRINIREHLHVGRPLLLMQLNINYEDETSESVVSDENWTMAEGPLLRNSVYLGEKYDAQKEQTGWDAPGFDASAWKPVTLEDEAKGNGLKDRLSASTIPPIRSTKTVSPIHVSENQPGVFIFDFGQNFAGWVSLEVEGPAGTTVQMRMGELIYEDGSLNPMTAVAGQIKGTREDGTPRGGPGAPEVAWQQNTYTLSGKGRERYTPQFTFHGFRYVEVTGFPGTPTLDSVRGLRLNTDVDPVGSFHCSNDRFNQIQEMVQWTFLSNLFSVQSDCPAREKFQYGGDIVASSEMAIFNYDMSTFYARTVAEHGDAIQGEGWFTETAPFVGISAANYAENAGPIGWGLAHPLLMSQLLQYYGDEQIIRQHFQAAKKWVDLLEKASDGYIIDRCIGDHESLDPKPIELIATAQFHQAASLVSAFASHLGDSTKAAHYEQMAGRIKEAFQTRFLDAGTGRFGSATQAAQAGALYHGLAPDHEVKKSVERMVEAVNIDHDGHIAAGIFGTKYLLQMLSEMGHSDTAYRMVDKKDYPGWGHMLENGATTLWETWAQSDNVYSQNHPMFGSVSEWFYKVLGGIQPAASAVGFDRFSIKPFVSSELEWMTATYQSVRGPISCKWKISNELLSMDIDVPVNTSANLTIPTADAASLRESGKRLSDAFEPRRVTSASGQAVQLRVESGQYHFEAKAPSS